MAMTTITNQQTGTNISEIADGVYRISTPIPPSAIPIPGGFTFNQFLIAAAEPLLFHTGMRGLFPLVRDAVSRVLPVERLRYVAFSHHEADEDGSMAEWLAAAPQAQALCGRTAATLQGPELTRPPRALADGEELSLGDRTVRWIDAPHVPHGWDCGFMAELRTRTLFCGDLFTQPGADGPARTEGDILGPSEAMRGAMDYYAHAPHTRATLERLAALEPRTLACMHGSSYGGDGAALLRTLADALCGR
jgi:flavorubredoxin